MHKLLFLVHRIPYPPNKGDKIRSYHILEHLAKRYEIYLGAFIDNDEDWQYISKLSEICKGTHFNQLSAFKSKLNSFSGLLKREALTLPYYRNAEMQVWVDKVINNEKIEQVLIYSSAMAQYVSGEHYKSLYRVIDFVDIDSDKWRQYAGKKSWPMNWIYRRESQFLEEYEKKIACEFQYSYFVSKNEADMFAKLLPEHSHKIRYFNNGVDTEYFSPYLTYENPYPENVKVIVFTGAMDYWANIDAVTWFADKVFPRIKQKLPATHFYIVGTNPGDEVQNLEGDAISVTGAVPDIRPYIAHADIVVAPLRIARGIQNKVLEAMAMAKVVVTTPQAYEGIEIFESFIGNVCEDPEEMAKYCVSVLGKDIERLDGNANREFVVANYNWDSGLELLSKSLK